MDEDLQIYKDIISETMANHPSRELILDLLYLSLKSRHIRYQDLRRRLSEAKAAQLHLPFAPPEPLLELEHLRDLINRNRARIHPQNRRDPNK